MIKFTPDPNTDIAATGTIKGTIIITPPEAQIEAGLGEAWQNAVVNILMECEPDDDEEAKNA